MSISGFYYMALHRRTGELTGWYYDASCHPYQKVTLTPLSPGSGMAIPSVELR